MGVQGLQEYIEKHCPTAVVPEVGPGEYFRRMLTDTNKEILCMKNNETEVVKFSIINFLETVIGGLQNKCTNPQQDLGQQM